MDHAPFAAPPRVAPRPEGDAAVMHRIDGMRCGDSLAISTRQDPVALIAEIEQRHPGAFSFHDLRTDPDTWHLVVRR